MSSVAVHPPAAMRWERWARPFIRGRHPILIAVVLFHTWQRTSPADWGTLSDGAHGLFSSSALSTYAAHPGLQAGPPGLLVVRALDVLPGGAAVKAAQLLLALLGWYLLYLAERWSVPGVRFGSAPVLQGLMTLLVGVPVLASWAALAGGAPHVEDGMALLGFIFAARALSEDRGLRAAVLVGLAAATKPWAIVAVPLLWGLPHKGRALVVALAVPLVCWLPFVLGDHATLSAVSDGFGLQAVSPLRALGVSGGSVPNWWRTFELTGSLAAAALAGWRRDWRLAFAAGGDRAAPT